MRHTQIDKITGEPNLENHYNLYKDGRVICKDVPFEILGAAPQMLAALELILESIEFHGDHLHERLIGVEVVKDAIEKAKGGSYE